MRKEALKRLILEEYAKAYQEIVEGYLKAIPGDKGEPKNTFYVKSTKNWGLSSGKTRKQGRKGDTTTPDRLMKLVDLNLITNEDFTNYNGDVSLHKLIGSNNSDAKYIMSFLLGRIKVTHPEISSLLEENPIITNDFGVEEEIVKVEGARKTIEINTYERDRNLREKKIKANNGDCSCAICGFNFEKQYGEIGKGFIHVHHLQALSEVGSAHEVKTEHLLLVCPNCHAMLHRRKPMYKPEDIKEYLARNRKVVL